MPYSWNDPGAQNLWTLTAQEIALLPGMTDKGRIGFAVQLKFMEFTMKISQTLWALYLFKRSRKNRLPRGFKRVQIVIEDLADFAFQPGEVKPYDLSQFKPFGNSC